MIDVVVVDDQLATVKAWLDEIVGFRFHYTESFEPEEVIKFVKATKNTTVLLLDVMTTAKTDAGIKLFRELGNKTEWKNIKGSVQVVFFSNDMSVKREYAASTAPEKEYEAGTATADGSTADGGKTIVRSRHDLSGFLAKDALQDGEPSAIDELRLADQRAKKYRDCPSLANSLYRKCELLFSTKTKSMQAVIDKIAIASRCWEPVLIQGETGTGKELVAEAIHREAKSWAMAKLERIKTKGLGGFYAYNIGSAPTEGNLQYTELFGALPESYSGCTLPRKGLFEFASETWDNKEEKYTKDIGGTIFLDEIGDADPTIQVALLRVLQENIVIPLGGFSGQSGQEKGTKEKERQPHAHEIPVKFRLITASHHDLPDDVAKRAFREDLYYRLSTIKITIPPLRERKDDIPLLVFHFLDKLNREYFPLKHEIRPEDEKELMKELRKFDWPGNVRQLEAVIRASYVALNEEEPNFRISQEELLALRHQNGDIAVRADSDTPEQILERLTKRELKMSFEEIIQKYNRTTAIKVGELFIIQNGYHHPNAAQARDMFNSNIANCRKWLNENGLSVRQMKKERSLS